MQNPIQDNLCIELGNDWNRTQLKIYSTLGIVYYCGIATQPTFTIATDTFPEGVYFIQITSDTKSYSLKAVK